MRPAKDVIINESLEELRKLQQKLEDSKSRLRIQFLIYIKEGKIPQRSFIAKALGKEARTIRRWAAEYREKGLKYFIENRAKEERKSGLDVIKKELKEKVSNPINPLRSYKEVVQWIKKEFNIEANYFTVRSYLKRKFKTKLKVPRRSHCKKDPVKVEEFKKKRQM